MKKFFLCSFTFGFLCFGLLKAQSTQTSSMAKDLIKTADDLKTGNYQDVLTSFFQLAANDIAGSTRSFQFKSTLFAIKLRADSTLAIDRNYLKQYFSRNLQFNIQLNTTENFHFSGFSGGATYAIINGRDRTLANFQHTWIDTVTSAFLKNVGEAEAKFAEEIENDPTLSTAERNKLLAQVNDGLNIFFSKHTTDSLPKRFLKFVDQKTMPALLDSIEAHRLQALDDLDKKPLWTVTASGTTNSFSHLLDEGTLETAYLQGSTIEADIRANLTYKDTVSGNDNYRLVFNSTAGANITLLKSRKNNMHLIEIKPNVEFDHAFSGLLPSGDQYIFYANAEIRIRVYNNLWIPIEVKYDTMHNNFLGFLNLSWNLDAFKNFLKGS